MIWSVVNLVVATVVGIITARMLGASARGTLAIMLSSVGLATLIGALGTNVAVRRRLPRGETTVRSYIRVSAVLFTIYIVLIAGALLALGRWVDPSLTESMVALALIAYAAAFFWSNQLFDLLNAVGAMPLSAATNAAGTSICLGCLSITAWIGMGFTAVVLSYAISVTCQIGIAYWFLKSRLPGNVPDATRPGIVRDGVRLLGLNLGQALAYRVDTLLIGVLSSTFMAGIYAVAMAPAGILRLPATAVGQVMLHDVATGLVNSRRVWLRIAQIEIVIAVCAGGGWLLAEPAILLIYGSEYAQAAGVLRVLLLAELALAPFLVLSRALVGVGGTWSASSGGIAGAIALAALGVALIPPYGAYGGAWASVGAYSLMSIVSGLQFLRLTRSRDVDEVAAPTASQAWGQGRRSTNR